MAFRLSNLRSSSSTICVAGVYFKWLLGGVFAFNKEKKGGRAEYKSTLLSSAMNGYTETNDIFLLSREHLHSQGT